MRKKGQNKFIFLVVILLIGAVLNACSSNEVGSSNDETAQSNENTDPSNDQVINLTAGTDFTSLDPHHASDAPSFDALYHIRSGLVTLDETGEIIPDMAESMPEVDDSQTIYTFTLRDDIKWSNGDPVTAQDFVFAWRRAVNPDTAAEYGFIFESARIKNASEIMFNENSNLYGKVEELGIEAVDERTLKVTLEKPTPYFVSLMSFPPFYPLNEKFVKEQGEDFATGHENMLSNGPFILTEWKIGEGWTFEKNPDYWNADKIKMEKINYSVVKDTATAVNLYLTDQIDFTKLSSQFINQFENSNEFNKGELTADIKFIRLNQKHEALANENIRKAIYNAIDREQLVNDLLKNGASPAYYVVPKDFAFGPDGEDFRSAFENINKKSLDEALKYWNKGLEELGTKEVELDLMIHESTLEESIATFLKGQLEENLPGLTVNIDIQTYNNHLKLEGEREYDMSYWGWLPDFRDPITYLDIWVTDGPFNRTGYSNPEYDALIEEANNLGDEPEKRWEILQEAEKILLEDAAIVPTYQNADAYVKKPYVNNLILRSYGPTVDLRYAYIEGK